MQEDDWGPDTDHVVVNGYDLKPILTEGLEHGR